MIDIEGADKKVKQIDGLFTSIEKLFKKHWLTIIILIFVAFGYYLFKTLPDQNSPAVNNQGGKILHDTVFVETPNTNTDTVAYDSTKNSTPQ